MTIFIIVFVITLMLGLFIMREFDSFWIAVIYWLLAAYLLSSSVPGYETFGLVFRSDGVKFWVYVIAVPILLWLARYLVEDHLLDFPVLFMILFVSAGTFLVYLGLESPDAQIIRPIILIICAFFFMVVLIIVEAIRSRKSAKIRKLEEVQEKKKADEDKKELDKLIAEKQEMKSKLRETLILIKRDYEEFTPELFKSWVAQGVEKRYRDYPELPSILPIPEYQRDRKELTRHRIIKMFLDYEKNRQMIRGDFGFATPSLPQIMQEQLYELVTLWDIPIEAVERVAEHYKNTFAVLASIVTEESLPYVPGGIFDKSPAMQNPELKGIIARSGHKMPDVPVLGLAPELLEAFGDWLVDQTVHALHKDGLRQAFTEKVKIINPEIKSMPNLSGDGHVLDFESKRKPFLPQGVEEGDFRYNAVNKIINHYEDEYGFIPTAFKIFELQNSWLLGSLASLDSRALQLVWYKHPERFGEFASELFDWPNPNPPIYRFKLGDDFDAREYAIFNFDDWNFKKFEVSLYGKIGAFRDYNGFDVPLKKYLGVVPYNIKDQFWDQKPESELDELEGEKVIKYEDFFHDSGEFDWFESEGEYMLMQPYSVVSAMFKIYAIECGKVALDVYKKQREDMDKQSWDEVTSNSIERLDDITAKDSESQDLKKDRPEDRRDITPEDVFKMTDKERADFAKQLMKDMG